jgi:hypothetical protein
MLNHELLPEVPISPTFFLETPLKVPEAFTDCHSPSGRRCRAREEKVLSRRFGREKEEKGQEKGSIVWHAWVMRIKLASSGSMVG